MILYKNLKDQVIDRLFLKIFPPYGETNPYNIDISLGISLKGFPSTMWVISAGEDLTSPAINREKLPTKTFAFNDFHSRIGKWMNEQIMDAIDYEYYEVTSEPLFSKIVSRKIVGISLIQVKGLENGTIGVKFFFEEDFVISIPNCIGNTIVTSLFNEHDCLQYFRTLGAIVYQEL